MLTWPARRALLRTQPSGHVPPPHRCADLPVGCAASYAPLVPVACVNDCMGRGSCHDGVCECQPGWTYFDCSIRAPTRAPIPKLTDPNLTQPTAAVCRNVCCRLLCGAGLCFNGTCQCRDGFCGGDCSQKCFPNNCSACASVRTAARVTAAAQCPQASLSRSGRRGIRCALATPGTLASTARSRRAPRTAAGAATATTARATASLVTRGRAASAWPVPMTAPTAAAATAARACAPPARAASTAVSRPALTTAAATATARPTSRACATPSGRATTAP